MDAAIAFEHFCTEGGQDRAATPCSGADACTRLEDNADPDPRHRNSIACMDVAVSRALSRGLFDPDRRHIAHVSPTMLVAGHDDAETIERLAVSFIGDEH